MVEDYITQKEKEITQLQQQVDSIMQNTGQIDPRLANQIITIRKELTDYKSLKERGYTEQQTFDILQRNRTQAEIIKAQQQTSKETGLSVSQLKTNAELKRIESQTGLKPVYQNGVLVGFEDRIRQQSIPLGEIGNLSKSDIKRYESTGLIKFDSIQKEVYSIGEGKTSQTNPIKENYEKAKLKSELTKVYQSQGFSKREASILASESIARGQTLITPEGTVILGVDEPWRTREELRRERLKEGNFINADFIQYTAGGQVSIFGTAAQTVNTLAEYSIEKIGLGSFARDKLPFLKKETPSFFPNPVMIGSSVLQSTFFSPSFFSTAQFSSSLASQAQQATLKELDKLAFKSVAVEIEQGGSFLTIKGSRTYRGITQEVYAGGKIGKTSQKIFNLEGEAFVMPKGFKISSTSGEFKDIVLSGGKKSILPVQYEASMIGGKGVVGTKGKVSSSFFKSVDMLSTKDVGKAISSPKFSKEINTGLGYGTSVQLKSKTLGDYAITSGMKINKILFKGKDIYATATEVTKGFYKKLTLPVSKSKGYTSFTGGLGKKSSESFLSQMYKQTTSAKASAIFSSLKFKTTSIKGSGFKLPLKTSAMKISPVKQSSYYGQGVYERTEGYSYGLKSYSQLSGRSLSVSQLTLPSIKSSFSLKLPQATGQIQKSMQNQKLSTVNLSSMKMNIKEVNVLKTKTMQMQNQRQLQQQKLVQRQRLITSTPTRTTPTIKPPTIKITTKPPLVPTLKFKILSQPNMFKQGVYNVSVRRGGIFSTIGSGLSLKKALSLGREKTAGTLAATFKIEGGDLSRVPTPKGFRKKKAGIFIELPKFRLSRKTETQEIQLAKLKGGKR